MQEIEWRYRATLQKMSVEEMEAEIAGLEARVRELENNHTTKNHAETTWGIRDTMHRLGIAKYELKQRK